LECLIDNNHKISISSQKQAYLKTDGLVFFIDMANESVYNRKPKQNNSDVGVLDVSMLLHSIDSRDNSFNYGRPKYGSK
jgi:hypothetical protein